MNAAKLNYLTVQDVIWINLQITQKVQKFQFAELEEATFYQFGYGKSSNLLEQAANLINGFSKKAPFASGDGATAFIAMVGFLSINGRQFNLPDGEVIAWLGKIGSIAAADVESASTHVADGPIFEKTGEHGEPHMEDTLSDALARYTETVSELLTEPTVGAA